MMKRILKISFIAWIGISLFSQTVSAKQIAGLPVRKQNENIVKKVSAGCSPASASVDLDINNVRARILNGGDMWWDLVNNARYEIPKVTEVNQVRRQSLFAGALWIGGFERNNLKLAAMTYRQSGSDFYPGPLDTLDATIDAEQCTKYDRIWKINKSEIDRFRLEGVITKDIEEWPAHPIDRGRGQSNFLAPYVDLDGIPGYNPSSTGGENSDYPDIKGDQALWWIYNDKGNIHNETKGTPIGLEIRTMAFAYVTNDQINNMTFYQNTIINRGKSRLEKTYFGQWVDADLGYAYDDYVGCDTTLDLGICYNGDNVDDGALGYGINPPSIGVDFFEGPTADDSDGVDNNKNGIIDEKGEKIGMSKFVYYDNDFSDKGNPTLPEHFYNYLTGIWKNGREIINDGRDGFTGTGIKTNYMFPGEPESNDPNVWNERTAKNRPGDRRFIQSAGPFTLLPGAVNNVTVGVVWARASSGGPTGSIKQLKFADKKAQILYNNSFEAVLGPQGPIVDITELDRKVILSLTNKNFLLDSAERFDKEFPSSIPGRKRRYKFEGYLIYQLKNSSVTSSDLDNNDKARLVAQCDVKNSIDLLVNEEFEEAIGSTVSKFKVKGENLGIRHTFEITSDLFAAGDDKLVNNRFYYYLVLAYASNGDDDEPEKFLAGRPSELNGNQVLIAVPQRVTSQLMGSKLNADYGDIPQITTLEGTGNGGLEIDLTPESESFLFANKTNKTVNPIYVKGKGPISVKVFDPLRLPNYDFELHIKDPLATAPVTRNGQRVGNNTTWTLYNKTAGYTGNQLEWNSRTSIQLGNEQVIPELGIAINIAQPTGPAFTEDSVRTENGFISATIEFKDPKNVWLTGIRDQDAEGEANRNGLPSPLNWIRSGKFRSANGGDITGDYMAPKDPANTNSISKLLDPESVYEDLLGGIIAPAPLVARSWNGTNNSNRAMTMGAMPEGTLWATGVEQTLASIGSVDIIFTPDRSKWSKCLVLEMGEDASLNEGGARKFEIRKGKNPFVTGADGLPTYAPGQNNEVGFSWFPGYAINIETGERLNIIFGEDSYLESENGRDMLWNPTNTNYEFNYQNPATIVDPTAFLTRYLLGGKHWFWVMNSRFYAPKLLGIGNPCYQGYEEVVGSKSYGVAYDECATYHKILSPSTGCTPTPISLQNVFYGAQWVMCPVLTGSGKLLSPEQGFIPNEARIKIRIAKPYASMPPSDKSSTAKNNNNPVYGFSTKDLAPTVSKVNGSEALKDIAVTPNPYYAYSSYETSQLDNRVRISNLPPKCKVTIYNLEGSIVRTYNVAQTAQSEVNPRTTSYLDWDLKNNARVPISSGVYLIHIDAGELGQTVLKWFGIMKKIDLDSF